MSNTKSILQRNLETTGEDIRKEALRLLEHPERKITKSTIGEDGDYETVSVNLDFPDGFMLVSITVRKDRKLTEK